MVDTFTFTIAGVTVIPKEGSFTVGDTLEQRSTLSFVVIDATGTASYQFGSKVSITSSVHGLLYTGLVYQDDDVNIYPQAHRAHKIVCMDNHWFADKLYFRKADYVAINAAVAVCDILNTYLTAEGIQAVYAYRPDNTQATLAGGTLTNTTAATTITSGDLELTAAGSTVTITESSFTSGTLNGTDGNFFGTLVPLEQNALHVQGTSVQVSSNGNNYVYIRIWSGSYTVQSGDNLDYGIWLSSTNPNYTGGVDFIFTDGTALRGFTALDQNGVDSHPGSDLSGYATNRRYYRSIDLTAVVGKTVSSVQVALEGDPAGTYDMYVDSIQVYGSGGLAQTFYLSGTPTAVTLSNVGYMNVSLAFALVFPGNNNSGNRISPSYSLAGAGIVKSSIISWAQTAYPASYTAVTTTGTAANTPPALTGLNKQPYITIEVSLDGGATWLLCTNHQPVPGLLAGMNLSGKSIQMRQTVNIAGVDPTISPQLQSVVLTVNPSYSATKTDVTHTTSTSGNWNAGTNTNVLYTSGSNTLGAGLGLFGYLRNFDVEFGDGVSNMTLYGTGGSMRSTTGAAALTAGATTDVRARLDFANGWGDFTMEVDVFLTDATGDYGVVYRTSGWQATNNTYGYVAYFNYGQVALGHGTNSNSGGGTFTLISSTSVTFNTNQWYHLTVVALGSNHKVYVDGLLYINATDSTYSSPADVGLRHYNNTGSAHTALFRNFGILVLLSGNHVDPSVSISSVGTVGNSIIAWDATTPSNTTLTVQTSINGGSTYTTCTNGGAIPLLPAGTNVSGKSLLVKVLETTNNANASPVISSLYWSVQGAYSASGNRISPALATTGLTYVGSASVSWNSILPTNTTLLVDTSPDGSTWTNVGSGASGSATISGITIQAVPTADAFATNTTASYTATTLTGGSAATWTYDSTNLRIVSSGGTSAQYLYTSITSVSDVDLFTDMDYSDSGGLTWRRSSASNAYEVEVRDASASSSANTLFLYKVSGGVRSTLASSAISFTRNTYHRVRVTMLAGVITVQFDGTQVISYTDGSPLAGGQVGFRTNGGTAHFYQLWAQNQGTNVATGGFGHVYSRARLTSTDPTVTPLVTQLSLALTNPNIGPGAQVDSTNYQNTKTLAGALDDLAKRSGYTWKIDKNKALLFDVRTSTPAPWVIQATDIANSTCRANTVTISTGAPTYRNRSVIEGGVDVTALQTETKIGDNNTQSWPLKYPVSGTPTPPVAITQDGLTATVGILHVDTGKQFYYQPGSNIFSQDGGATALTPLQTITVSYYGQVTATGQYDDTTEQTAFAALEGGTGIVEVVESVPTLTIAASNALAQSRVQQNEIRGKTLKFQTSKFGLAPGQYVSAFLPQHQLINAQFLVAKVSATYYTAADTSTPGWYTVECVQGAVLKDWTSILVNK